jgi:antitoxin CptB
MIEDLDSRRRRAAWRASHRGTKELDMLIGCYADATLPSMAEAELCRFEEFLNLEDPALQSWLLAPGIEAGHEHADIVAAVRQFHGLDRAESRDGKDAD